MLRGAFPAVGLPDSKPDRPRPGFVPVWKLTGASVWFQTGLDGEHCHRGHKPLGPTCVGLVAPQPILSESTKTQKRELVVSRFTLLGHLRPHAGKCGPFLLHGG